MSDFLRAVLKYDPNQPRAPKGSEDGGQWIKVGAGNVLAGYSSKAKLDERGWIITSNVDDAVKALNEGKHVELQQVREVATLLDKLATIAKEAEAAGEKAPVYDLCKVSVKGTNLFCADALDIDRAQMPQFLAFPVPGSPADALPRRPRRGTVDAAPAFLEHLRAEGFTAENTTESAAYLRASQRQLNGAKVGAMIRVIKERGGMLDAPPMLVSADNYIIDGHHRWAALVGMDAEDNKLGDVKLPITRVNIRIIELLERANAFTTAFGMQRVDVSKREWCEPCHARGKTTEESNAGSFAPQTNGLGGLRGEQHLPMPRRGTGPASKVSHKLNVLFNPTQDELLRWAGRDISGVRWIKWAGNTVFWEDWAAIHSQVRDALVRSGSARESDFSLHRGYLQGENPVKRIVTEDLNSYFNLFPVKKSWLSELLKWDEKDHPRGETVEGTNKGSFRPKNTGFVSPNIDENVDFTEAANRIQSHRTKLLLKANEEIAAYFGTETVETVGVGAWADGAEQSLIVDGNGDFEAFKAHMALSGLLADQKAVVAFTNDANGPDSVYRLSVGNRSLKEVHAALLEEGVQFHTLRKTDHNVDVFVFSPGSDQELQNAVAKAAERFGVDEVATAKGYGEFVGSWDSREEGRAAYEAVLDAYEGQVPGHDGGWKALRDRWLPRLAAVRKSWLEEVLKFDPDQPRAPAGTSEGGQWVKELTDRDTYVSQAGLHKPTESYEANQAAWSDYYTKARPHEKAWERQMDRAISTGQITEEEARRNYGFFSNARNYGGYKDVPETLYHVTTALSRVQEEGFKTREEHGRTGLGGGTSDTISFTASREMAEQYLDAVKFSRAFMRDEVSHDTLLATAKNEGFYTDLEGTYRNESSFEIDGRPSALMDAVQGTRTWKIPEVFRDYDAERLGKVMAMTGVKGWDRREGDLLIKDLSDEDRLHQRAEFLNRYLFWREVKTKIANPAFFTNNWDDLIKAPDSEIALVEVKAAPKTRGYYLPAEHEYRIMFGDLVKLSSVIRKMDDGVQKSWLHTLVKFVPWQPRWPEGTPVDAATGAGGGRWAPSEAHSGYNFPKDADGKPIKGETWRDRDGNPVSEEIAARLKAGGVPAGYSDIVLNEDPTAPTIAIGKDAKGREKRFYSKEWHEGQAAKKFDEVRRFHQALPAIREKIVESLGTARGKDLIAAQVLYVLDQTGFRIGGGEDELADKDAFGITTITSKHVKVDGDKVSFNFPGKKGEPQAKTLTDSRLASIVTWAKSNAARNQPLFDVSSGKVNDFLKELSGQDFSAKDFRTWHGTAKAVIEMGKWKTLPKTEKEMLARQRKVLDVVADWLGNTRAVAKSAYVDPAVWTWWTPLRSKT